MIGDRDVLRRKCALYSFKQSGLMLVRLIFAGGVVVFTCLGGSGGVWWRFSGVISSLEELFVLICMSLFSLRFFVVDAVQSCWLRLRVADFFDARLSDDLSRLPSVCTVFPSVVIVLLAQSWNVLQRGCHRCSISSSYRRLSNLPCISVRVPFVIPSMIGN